MKYKHIDNRVEEIHQNNDSEIFPFQEGLLVIFTFLFDKF